MSRPAAPLAASDEVVYRLSQSAGVHLLVAALGVSLALLAAALRLPWTAAMLALASAMYAGVSLRARTQVLATRRRLVVRRALGEESMRLAEVRGIRLEKDLWSRNLVVKDEAGRTLRVRDLRDPAGALAVLDSLARAARERPAPAPAAEPDLLAAFLPPASAAERAAVGARLAHKAAVRPVDLGFLDERGAR